VRDLQKKLGLLLEKEDLKWKQRAKRTWYQLADKNIKFFHECASQRIRRNYIREILDAQRRNVKDQKVLRRYSLNTSAICLVLQTLQHMR
jgi:hypothetical protein